MDNIFKYLCAFESPDFNISNSIIEDAPLRMIYVFAKFIKSKVI